MNFQGHVMYKYPRLLSDSLLIGMQTDLYALFRTLSIPNIVVLIEVSFI